LRRPWLTKIDAGERDSEAKATLDFKAKAAFGRRHAHDASIVG
jgi:hypothetical protein